MDILKADYFFIREATIARNEQEMRDLHDILYAMELRFTERETEAQQEFQGLVDELKNKVRTVRNDIGW